jgi:hypothetical protein
MAAKPGTGTTAGSVPELSARVEFWQSNDNKTEVHLFLGQEDNTYLFGFNPRKVDTATVQAVFRHLQLPIPEGLWDLWHADKDRET